MHFSLPKFSEYVAICSSYLACHSSAYSYIIYILRPAHTLMVLLENWLRVPSVDEILLSPHRITANRVCRFTLSTKEITCSSLSGGGWVYDVRTAPRINVMEIGGFVYPYSHTFDTKR